MNLKEYLRINCMTQKEFAEKVGLTEASITRFMTTSGYIPAVKTIRKIRDETKGEVGIEDWPQK